MNPTVMQPPGKSPLGTLSLMGRGLDVGQPAREVDATFVDHPDYHPDQHSHMTLVGPSALTDKLLQRIIERSGGFHHCWLFFG
jgi:hypothetical protein